MFNHICLDSTTVRKLLDRVLAGEDCETSIHISQQTVGILVQFSGVKQQQQADYVLFLSEAGGVRALLEGCVEGEQLAAVPQHDALPAGRNAEGQAGRPLELEVLSS